MRARSATPFVAATPLLLAAAAAWATDRSFYGLVLLVGAMGLAAVLLLVGHPPARRLLPALVPLLLATLVGLYGATDGGYLRGTASGDPGFADRSALLAAAGLVMAVLLAAGVDVPRLVARFVDVVGRALTLAGAAVVFGFLLVPAWLWSRARRRDVLRGGRTRAAAPGWHRLGGAPSRAGSLGSAVQGVEGRRSLTGRLTWSLGCLILLLGANFGIGWGWDRATDDPAPPVPTARPEDAPANGPTVRDPRNDVPAMAAYPWRERYFTDIQRMPGTYWPFTEYRAGNFSSPYVNQTGWIRRSYQPEGDADAMPSVWMFGGSTTWGEGQRDEYTIASWIARLAEEDGLPLRMDNYGERGWTHFQEMILYQQELSLGGRPDFSVFYDGANEINAQSLLNVAVPSHTLAYTYAQKLFGGAIATRFTEKPPEDEVLADLWNAYTEHSAIHKLASVFKPDPAGAAPAQDAPPAEEPGGEFTGGQEQRDNGSIFDYTYTPQDGTDAGRVYEDGKRLTMSLSRRYDVRSLLFWQPVQYNGPAQENARAQLTDPTIDIADVLEDHGDVFIDGGHTNEEGARLVAVEIWSHLKPQVEQWYEERS